MSLIRWAAVAGLLVATEACGGATEPSDTAKFGNIRLTVSGSSPEVVLGSAVTFRVDLLNEGSQAATLHFGDLCRIHPTIRNELGAIVLPPGGVWGCPTVTNDLILLPGQPSTWNLLWRGAADFESALFYTGSTSPLPPGKYVFSTDVPVGGVTLTATTPITLK